MDADRLKCGDHAQSGVRRKSPIECTNNENALVASGTKKKVRPNINAKSPNKEYYQIWTTAENSKLTDAPSASAADDSNEFKEEAPPLPPRALHRPLERSHAFPVPPVVPRQHKPKKSQVKPEDSFGFELIDVDEPLIALTTQSPSPVPPVVPIRIESPDHVDVERQQKHLKPMMHLSKAIGSDNYITTVLPKNVLRNTSSPVLNESKCSHHSSLSNCSSTSTSTSISSGSEEQFPGVPEATDLKPHKPLSRQLSNASANAVVPSMEASTSSLENLHKRMSNESSTSSLESPTLCDHDENCMNNNLTGTPLSKKSDFLEMTGTPVHSKTGEPIISLMRPHPRALARVAGLSNNLPVCPPTPTHHARKSRNAKEALRPPTLKQPLEPSADFEIVTSPEIKHADIRAIDTLDGWAHAHTSQPQGQEGADFVDGQMACGPCTTFDEDSPSKGISGHKTLTKPTWSLKVGNENTRLELKTLGDIHSIDTRPPDVRSQDLTKTEDVVEGEASGGAIPLPLRHLTSTRLPSIPERSSRVVIDTEQDEPLPTCN